MTEQPARAALLAALSDWRRHAVAAVLVVAAFAVAELLAAPTARYGAYLVAFAVWMAWFVLTCVEWLRRADF
ncbi:MAG: hypothetical protein V5A62_08130 [Haloarculaceae archaeon]